MVRIIPCIQVCISVMHLRSYIFNLDKAKPQYALIGNMFKEIRDLDFNAIIHLYQFILCLNASMNLSLSSSFFLLLFNIEVAWLSYKMYSNKPM